MGYKIYIVEDMAVSCIALTTLLEEHGHNVIGSAARADEAWVTLKELEVDIVLLDINLAGDKDGIWAGKNNSYSPRSTHYIHYSLWRYQNSK